LADVSIFRVLYALAARAPTLAPDAFLQRLVTGLANFYGADGCALYTDESGWAAAAADPAPAVAKLGRLDRARLETIEARLVRETVSQRRMLSALDLEEDHVDRFLETALGITDVFGFPVSGRDEEAPVQGVLVLYLGENARAFRDPDMYALSSLGGLLELAGRAAGED
jgi:hypothetical protein